MGEFIDFLHSNFLILLMIFVAVFLLILATRLILVILLHFAKNKYEEYTENKRNRNQNEQQSTKPKYPKEDQELFIKKELPGKNHSYEKLPVISEEQESEIEEVRIVDIVKPVGKWTQFIIGRELSYLVNSARVMNKKSKKGFWVSMIEAQQIAAGRQRGRGSR